GLVVCGTSVTSAPSTSSAGTPMTTAGRTLAVIPRSTHQTSRRRGVIQAARGGRDRQGHDQQRRGSRRLEAGRAAPTPLGETCRRGPPTDLVREALQAPRAASLRPQT